MGVPVYIRVIGLLSWLLAAGLFSPSIWRIFVTKPVRRYDPIRAVVGAIAWTHVMGQTTWLVARSQTAFYIGLQVVSILLAFATVAVFRNYQGDPTNG